MHTVRRVIRPPFKKSKGATTVVLIGVTFAILLFAMFFMEIINIFNIQYAIAVKAQRALNSTLEWAIDDASRADGKNIITMNNTAVCNKLYEYLREDLGLNYSGICYGSDGNIAYRVTFGTVNIINGRSAPHKASIQIELTVRMNIGQGIWRRQWQWTNTFKSENFRTDEDARAGW